MIRILKRDIVIRAGVYLDDDQDIELLTPREKACDAWMKLLPGDYFEEKIMNLKGGKNVNGE